MELVSLFLCKQNRKCLYTEQVHFTFTYFYEEIIEEVYNILLNHRDGTLFF